MYSNSCHCIYNFIRLLHTSLRTHASPHPLNLKNCIYRHNCRHRHRQVTVKDWPSTIVVILAPNPLPSPSSHHSLSSTICCLFSTHGCHCHNYLLSTAIDAANLLAMIGIHHRRKIVGSNNTLVYLGGEHLILIASKQIENKNASPYLTPLCLGLWQHA